MENYFNSQNQDTKLEIVITEQARIFLRETAKWAKFLSILGFIGVVFMVLAGFMMGALMSTSFGSQMEASGVSGWVFSLVYIVMGALYVAPLYYLFQFSDKIKSALDSNDSGLLTNAFGFLKSHYKYIGIMTIVVMALYILFIIVAIIVALAGATALAGL